MALSFPQSQFGASYIVGMFRISRMEGGWSFCLEGAPVSNKVSERGIPKFYGDSEGGGYPFYYIQKCSKSCNPRITCVKYVTFFFGDAFQNRIFPLK